MHLRGRWCLEPWGAVRVAGLPADSLKEFRLERTAAIAEDLNRAEAALIPMREQLIDQLFLAIQGCDDRPLRRAMLTIKRRIYNARPLAPTLSSFDSVMDRVPSTLRCLLAGLVEAEANVLSLESRCERTFAEERDAASAALQRLTCDDRLLSAFLLSGNELWRTVERLQSLPAGTPLSGRQRRQQAAVARYLMRATVRTTPFSGFAAVALICLAEEICEPSYDGDHHATVHGDPAHTWSGVPQIHAGLLQQWIARYLSRAAQTHLPLRVTPLNRVETEPVPKIVFSRSVSVSSPPEGSNESSGDLCTLRSSSVVNEIMNVANGRSCHEIASLLASSEGERDHWLELIEHLVEIGLLERIAPHPQVDASGLRTLASRFESLGDPHVAQQLSHMANLLESYTTSTFGTRTKLVSKLWENLSSNMNVAPIYEDVMLEGLTTTDLGTDANTLKEDLLPALTLARSCLSSTPHLLICDAFMNRYGAAGTCRDVPAFLTELLEDKVFMARLRHANINPQWLHSPLGTAVRSAEGDCVSLQPSLFAQLDTADVPCGVAAFVQLFASNRGAIQAGDYRVVLNGVQSGRNKYLSRYLGNGTTSADAALKVVRTRLREAYSPLPVEILPILGTNFQVHPSLTEWALQIPQDSPPDGARILSLSDLSLRFAPSTHELRVYSERLKCDIEPVHLGFLRDFLLPDPLLLLRALSPRIGEETMAEGVDLYNLLDQWDIVHTKSLRWHRPRLTVGRLVLERARWAIPLVEVPVRSPGESYAAFFRRLTQWRAEEGLPERGFARSVARATYWTDIAQPRFYLDWYDSFTIVGLNRWLLGSKHRDAEEAWLVITELVPNPENALLNVNGRAHVSELLIQFEWMPEDD